jgi:hypothetical protein
MKTFEDIEFKPHGMGDGLQGLIFFPNGYGVSVVRFKFNDRFGSYTSNDDEWELAVIFGNENEWDITYNTPITSDVMGHLSSEEVTDIMKQVQEL